MSYVISGTNPLSIYHNDYFILTYTFLYALRISDPAAHVRPVTGRDRNKGTAGTQEHPREREITGVS